MKIRIVLADQDEVYVKKFVNCIKSNYFEKIELTVFTAKDALQKNIAENEYDVILYTEDFKNVDLSAETSILLTENKTEEDGQSICKYQKMNNIYKIILSVFADLNKSFSISDLQSEGETNVITFISPSGGAGKTTCAATYARMLAAMGKAVLFLSMEHINMSGEIFHTEGNVNLAQVFFWLKRKKGNLNLKIESSLQQDESGVYYWPQSENPLELTDVKGEDWSELIDLIVKMKRFHSIVIDTSDPIEERMTDILGKSNGIVWICKNEEVDRQKTKIVKKAYKILDAQFHTDILSKSAIVINYYKKNQQLMREIEKIPVIGAVQQTILGVSGKKVIDTLMEKQLAEGLRAIIQ